MPAKYCHSKKDVPTHKHYAIVIFGTYTVPGDERSRTHPGHGYPEHTEHSAEYIAYTDRAEWEAKISRLTLDEENFVPLVVDPAKVTTKVAVEVEDEGS